MGYVVGDVEGKTAVLVDDMIDTAGTLCAAAETVLQAGAARVIACATHGVFSGPAFERLPYENSQIERIVVTDTIPLADGRPGQHHRALDRADARRLDPPDLHRRLGLRDLRRREPALLSGRMAGGSQEKLAPGTSMALFAMGLGVFVIANDFTALNVALPAIESDFDVDVGTAQWVINAYALIFGLAIVTGGRFADMFGRKKIFFIGSALFAGFSLIGALAPDDRRADRRPRRHGDRRRDDVAGDPRHDLRGAAEEPGAARRRPDPRRRRDRQRDRAAARRRPDRADRAGARSSSSTSRSRSIAVARHRGEDPPEGGAPAARASTGSAWRRSRSACCCSSSASIRRPTGASATRGSSPCSRPPPR